MPSAKFTQRYRIDKPDRFRLADFDTADTALKLDKDELKALLAEDAERLGELQERLYAEDKWSVLIVLQGMDTAGKDGVIEHVMAGVNPQGCVVHAFKAPSAEEIDHDFLWRSAVRVPERGRIGIFNRSHYEEVLVVRVHPDLLARQKLPPSLMGKDIWEHRFKGIRGFERHLARSGTIVLKFFLHISREEQRQRLLARLDEPAKRWKFNPGTSPSASSGTNTWRPTRTRSARPAVIMHLGTLCRPTTSRSRAWSWRGRSWTRSHASTSNIRRSTPLA